MIKGYVHHYVNHEFEWQPNSGDLTIVSYTQGYQSNVRIKNQDFSETAMPNNQDHFSTIFGLEQ